MKLLILFLAVYLLSVSALATPSVQARLPVAVVQKMGIAVRDRNLGAFLRIVAENSIVDLVDGNGLSIFSSSSVAGIGTKLIASVILTRNVDEYGLLLLLEEHDLDVDVFLDDLMRHIHTGKEP